MIKNYLKIAWRNLIHNRVSSMINVGGLAVGMAVAMLIGLWVWDELAFDKYHQNYESIAQVMENQQLGDNIGTQASKPMPLANELRTKYGENFKYVAAVTFGDQVITAGNKPVTKFGAFTEPDFPVMMTIKMLQGNRASLKDPSSILISASLAKTLFGNADPVNKIIKAGDSFTLKVTGVYRDFPKNTTLSDVTYLAPLDLLFKGNDGKTDWHSSAFEMYVQLNPNHTFEAASVKIKNALYENTKDATKPALFLYPMSRWHLYADFKNGINTGGRIQFVWLFGIIGCFVLILACINFMNLSTARSEKRGKEVGIRKAIGSMRGQLIGQFFSESILIAVLAFLFSLVIVQVALPFFNDIAGKQVAILWTNPVFWMLCTGFSLFTGIVAGSYPAFYLSSFQPVKVLKGTFKAGKYAALPRKALIVLQFTVSIILIIGTIIVFRQIQFAKDRPIGYSRNNLITIPLNNDLQTHYGALRNDLLRSGAVSLMSESSSATTNISSGADNLAWKGKDPNRQAAFGTISSSADYGKTIGWKMKEGRDFSAQFTTDSAAFIFNEAAIEQMGLKNPVGETIKWHGKNFTVIGVVKNMVMRSPFDPAVPTVFMMNKERDFNVINIRLNPAMGTEKALNIIGSFFKAYSPAAPFDYKFVDQDYATKFANEERIGKLASCFAGLAIFISCLGLFGMASFMAEQRIKEIGVRKVLGATIFNLWQLLSKDFVLLVIIALLIASPTAYYFMHSWLQGYQYHTEINWWIFAVAAAGAMIITLLTVSYQGIKAALANPVKSLKSE
jgi:putative ABC transport system permease protein